LEDQRTSRIKRSSKIILLLAFFLIVSGLVSLLTFAGHNQDDIQSRDFRNHYRVFAVKIPDKLDFCGEAVPLHDFEVRERIDREFLVNTYWPAQTILLAKRSGRWFPLMEPILKRYGIPDDFKYLALVESGLTTGVSPKGAAGYWQFIPETASAFGLEVNDEVDERYHVQRSTEAACRFFKQAYQTLGSWTLAAAAFNYGISGIKRQLARQGANTYYDLVLNEETARYLFRLLAIREILKNPDDYGYTIRKRDLYPFIPLKTVEIDSSIADFALFARKWKVNYKVLKYFNAWLRTEKLSNPDKRKYYVLLPDTNSTVYRNLNRNISHEEPISD